MPYRVLCLALVSLSLCQAVRAQVSAGSTSAVWNALSAGTVDPAKSARVENVEIVRDRVHIMLADGTIQFLQSVAGISFGAVFHGNGRLKVTPPNATEAYQLQLFTKQTSLDMPFTEATFSFSDGLEEEISKQVKWQPNGPSSDPLYAARQNEREALGAQYLPRLFKSLLSPDRKRTAYFLADLKTKDKGWVEVRYDSTMLEEVRIGRWADTGPMKVRDVWMNFPAGDKDPRHAYDDPAALEDFIIPSYVITSTIPENAELQSDAKVTVRPRYSGERVLLFALDPNLRVSSVKDEQGHALEYYQPREQKDRYRSYGDYVAVVLQKPLEPQNNAQLEFQYAGKRVIYKVGNGNFFCKSFGWYPTPFESELGVDVFAFRSDFELTFKSPKKYLLAATGSKTSETIDGKELITTWKSDIPLAAAGFVFGDYKLTTDKVGDIEIQVYTNRQPDELLTSIQRAFDDPLRELEAGPDGMGMRGTGPMAAIGTLTPSALSNTISTETANTLRVFQSYFGPYPYKQLVVSNIIGSYGQGWPGMLYLGWFTFLDSTQQHALGMKNQVELTDFFRGHESSHQWWGHRVGWKSYHDQWLSEGFAEFSGKIFVQFRRDMKEFLNQFRRDKDLLRTGDIKSHRVDMLGPIWLGQRVASSETNGSSYQNLIYSKGGYVLQMLREQLQDPRNPDPDHLFKAMMQDYCKTFDNKPASTEDFKSIVEKHMLRSMDLDGNRRMDWFFNQYVYGIGEAHYEFQAALEPTSDGKTHVKAELRRSGVPDSWKDVIPFYAHAGDKAFRLGTIAATHNIERVDAALPGKFDRLTINDKEDLLAEVKQ
jgi:hypothetical protein